MPGSRAWSRFFAVVVLTYGLGACGSDSTAPAVGGGPEQVQIDEAGGVATAEGGRVTLTVPPGALFEATTITMERVTSEPADPLLVPGTLWEFGPVGLQFAIPPTLRLTYDPGVVPGGASAEDLWIFKRSGSDWVVAPNGQVSVSTGSVTGEITSFSQYAVRVGAFEPLALSSEDLPEAIDDWPYSGGFAVLGGAPPYSWRIVSGALPAGLSLASGLVEGTPTVVGTQGFTVEVSSQDGQTFERTLSVTVNPRPVLAPTEFCADNPPYAIVSFASASLEVEARGYIASADSIAGLPPREHFSCRAVEQITGLGVDTTGVDLSLVGIQNLVNLRNFGSNGNAIADLSPLASLSNFDGGLNLISAGITDVTPLAGLTQITGLYLTDNAISNVGPLASLTQLSILDLAQNSITDVSALSGLTGLEVLELSDNSIQSIDPLGGLTTLEGLWLNNNQINGDLSELSALANLLSLRIDSNRLAGVGSQFGTGVGSTLVHLSMANNAAVCDFDVPGFPYRSCIGGIAFLEVLEYLDLVDTPIGSFEPVLAFDPLFSSGLVPGGQVFLRGTRVNCGVPVELEARGVSVWMGGDCGRRP